MAAPAGYAPGRSDSGLCPFFRLCLRQQGSEERIRAKGISVFVNPVMPFQEVIEPLEGALLGEAWHRGCVGPVEPATIQKNW